MVPCGYQANPSLETSASKTSSATLSGGAVLTTAVCDAMLPAASETMKSMRLSVRDWPTGRPKTVKVAGPAEPGAASKDKFEAGTAFQVWPPSTL